MRGILSNFKLTYENQQLKISSGTFKSSLEKSQKSKDSNSKF